MTDDALIEAMARGAQNLLCSPWEDLDEEEQRATLEIHAAALAAIRKTHAVLPRVPSDEMRFAALRVGLPQRGDPPLYEMIYRAMLKASEDSAHD